MSDFQRARSAQQKEVRIRQITDAAIKLYGEMPYEKITLAAIADELSFTRANLYKYISSKEEIFLKVIENDLKAWINDLELRFGSASGIPLPAFARGWAVSLYQHKRLIELMSILFSIIEKNTGAQKLSEFKKGFMADLEHLTKLTNNWLPFLSGAQAETFVFMQAYYAIGLYPVTTQSEVQKKAVELSGVAYSVPDFADTLTGFIQIFLKGLLIKE